VTASTGFSPLARRITLEGCFNFRDLGGYRTADGRTVRWRRLFRADSLHRLTEGDLAQLADLGLATVIDLRTGAEVTDRGRVAWKGSGLAYHHLPMIDVVSNRAELANWTGAGYVAAHYADMLRRGGPAVTEALAVLTDPAAYPAVFHCAAGKNRTGILSAVILGLLGVSEEDIIADYALSRLAMVGMFEWLRAENPAAEDELDTISGAILPADPETMAMFLDQFRSDHGTFERFAASLGVAGAVAGPRAALLGP
jgi:protein-tyrosine phosphatase